MAAAAFAHIPVLLSEIIDALDPRPGGAFIDATVGGGGHAERILTLTGPEGRLLALDADPVALAAARERLAGFGARVTYVETYFNHLSEVAATAAFSGVDGVLFDLGVSSPQLDASEQGFSFSREAPLDMRMGREAHSTAADLVNTLTAQDLATLFFLYGDERHSRRIAARIVAERARARIATTTRLAAIVATVRPQRRGETIHPATRVFQALRIAVNDELERLRAALPQSVALLRPGGRLAVISFHSGEDRIVKQFIRAETQTCICPPGLPACVCNHQPTLQPVTRRPVAAGTDEVASNPRARSARLRVAQRLAA